LGPIERRKVNVTGQRRLRTSLTIQQGAREETLQSAAIRKSLPKRKTSPEKSSNPAVRQKRGKGRYPFKKGTPSSKKTVLTSFLGGAPSLNSLADPDCRSAHHHPHGGEIPPHSILRKKTSPQNFFFFFTGGKTISWEVPLPNQNSLQTSPKEIGPRA